MGVIEIIVLGGLFLAVVNLYGRLNTLEKRLEVTFKEIAERGLGAPAQTQTQPAAAAGQPVQSTSQPQSYAAPMQPQVPSSGDVLVEWLKENWLLKLGALLILLAFGWLVTYAFLNNWIGPAGRIMLGIVGGVLILLIGFWRMRVYVTQGAVFVALGATTILLTTYAARTLYDFFTPLTALALMFATSALVALISAIYNRKQLAIVSVALAGIAPMLTHSPTNDYIGLFWYLLIVVIGAVWIVAVRNFREVVTTAFLVVALYSFPLLVHMQRADLPTLLLFAYAFAAIFYLTNTAGLLRLKGDDAVPDLMTAAGNALLLIGWIYTAAAKEWQSLIIDAWAIAFVLGAYVIFRATRNVGPLFLYSAIGVAYIAASTAIVLHGAALTIAFTLEAAAVALVLYAITRDVVSSSRVSYLLIGPTLLSLPSIVSNEWSRSVLNEHFFVLAVLSGTFFVLAAVFWKDAYASKSEDAVNTNAVHIVAGSAFAYILLWQSLHAALLGKPDTAVMIALVVYTIVGLWTYIEGVSRGIKGLRMYGGILLGFVVGRLLIVDVWQMQLTGRIITFFLIGALLMSTAFLAREKKSPPSVPAPQP